MSPQTVLSPTNNHPQQTQSSTLPDKEQHLMSEEAPTIQKRPWLRRVGMLCVNAWIVMHLFAIIVAPATVGPSSRTARFGWECVAPYLQALYLNHGFHFFAPQPGSSSLCSYTLTFDDGSTKSGRFPDPDTFPRLHYHRHFMLSEYLGNTGNPELSDAIIRSYAKNLCREHVAKAVTLSMVRHNLPSMERIRSGGNLDDADLFEEQPLGNFQWDELQ